ncbi:MAG: hypothetical protein KDB69_08565 [Acidimicrobiia bacterium]|nr:hypothetical protein [Acidimicrobiia bacterium]
MSDRNPIPRKQWLMIGGGLAAAAIIAVLAIGISTLWAADDPGPATLAGSTPTTNPDTPTTIPDVDLVVEVDDSVISVVA